MIAAGISLIGTLVTFGLFTVSRRGELCKADRRFLITLAWLLLGVTVAFTLAAATTDAF